MGVFANALNPSNNRATGIENAVIARTVVFTTRPSSNFMDMSESLRIEVHINLVEKMLN